MTTNYRLVRCDAFVQLPKYVDRPINLLLFDPIQGILDEPWDFVESDTWYADYIHKLLSIYEPFMAWNGSIVFFGAVGWHGYRPLYKASLKIEESNLLFARDSIVWRKRRAYGLQDRFTFIREEIASYSVNPRHWVFRAMHTGKKRGYAGTNKNYPARSEYYRVGNVIDHIPELYKCVYPTQKPVALYELLIQSHSNPGDYVVDPYAGTGSCGVACLNTRRSYLGGEQGDVIEFARIRLAIRSQILRRKRRRYTLTR